MPAILRKDRKGPGMTTWVEATWVEEDWVEEGGGAVASGFVSEAEAVCAALAA
jgi:hypothetical protein